MPSIGGNPIKPRCGWCVATACACVVVLPAAIWLLPQHLARDGLILMVVTLACIGWTITRIGDTAIAVASAVDAGVDVLLFHRGGTVETARYIWIRTIVSAILGSRDVR